MSQVVLVIIAVVVLAAAYYFLRRTSATAEESVEAKPLTARSQLGFGIIALGVLTLAMPSASGSIAAFDFIESEAYAILIGSTYIMGFLVTLAGLAVLLVKEQ